MELYVYVAANSTFPELTFSKVTHFCHTRLTVFAVEAGDFAEATPTSSVGREIDDFDTKMDDFIPLSSTSQHSRIPGPINEFGTGLCIQNEAKRCRNDEMARWRAEIFFHILQIFTRKRTNSAITLAFPG